MLTKLNIQNYALIDDVSVDFTKGLTTITGETGAGKSILLEGLGLILGNRADTAVMTNKDKKCIIEGVFDISLYNLEKIFEENDLDYERQTVIRREILPGGKSRAFVNDTPVRLDVLTQLQPKLLDIHSQHQTLKLTDTHFQFEVLDTVADHKDAVSNYRILKSDYEKSLHELEELRANTKRENNQIDYWFHLLKELELADLKEDELEILEDEHKRLIHIDQIQSNLNEAFHLLSDENVGIVKQLNQSKNNLEKLQKFTHQYREFYERMLSVYLESRELEREIGGILDVENFSSDALEKVNARLHLLQQLMQKHSVISLKELIEIRDDIDTKVRKISNADDLIRKKESELVSKREKLMELSSVIRDKRVKILNFIESKVIGILTQLGIKDVAFKVELEKENQLNAYGMDSMRWLFSANKGNVLANLSKVASGGELSRIMMAIKSVLAEKSNLPTIIFDEIDTGISGDVAIKMGNILKDMSKDMQVICITHLPQIAAKGNQQLKVYKKIELEKTHTHIKNLNESERLEEIAEMLGGKQMSQSAMNHAEELLQLKK